MPQTQTHTANRTAARTARPAERFDTPKQCAGYRVRAPSGWRIGRLKRRFLNQNGGTEYAEIRVGLFGPKTIHDLLVERFSDWGREEIRFGGFRSPESVLIPIFQPVSPRISVNEGKKKGRGCYAPAIPLASVFIRSAAAESR